MAVQPQYLEYILEQLATLGGVRSRRMFGGVGLYSNDLFFGLIDDDTLFFKADARNLDDYLSRNMPRFMPDPARPAAALGYFQVPADVIEDAEVLSAWARKAVEVALASQSAKARPKRAPPATKRAKKSAQKTGKKSETKPRRAK